MDEMEKNERELNELETEVEFSEVEPNEVESNEVEAGEQEESKASEPKSLSKQAKIEKKSRFSNLFADRQKVMIFLVMLAIAVLMSGFFFC